MLVDNQLVCLLPVGIPNLVTFIWIFIIVSLVLKGPNGEWPIRWTFLHTYIPSRGSRNIPSCFLPATKTGMTSRMMRHLAFMQTWPLPTLGHVSSFALKEEFELSKNLWHWLQAWPFSRWTSEPCHKKTMGMREKKAHPQSTMEKYGACWHNGMLD